MAALACGMPAALGLLSACGSDDPAGSAIGVDNGDGDGNDAAPGCGNSILEDGEQCDVSDLGAATCESLGFETGVLRCRTNCTYDTLDCVAGASCGNGQLDPGEECDGNQLGGATCGSKGFAQGNVACNENCTLDATDCYSCGNGLVEGPEVCDGDNMASESCETRSHDGGELSCGSGCLTFDEEACTDCGDGKIEGEEQCESGTDLGSTCADQGFSGGDLTCDSSTCQYVTHECVHACSDGIDNDDDGFLDFPDDPGCTAADDNDEFVFADECDNVPGSVIYDITTEGSMSYAGNTFTAPTGFAGSCAPSAPGAAVILMFHSKADQTINLDLGDHLLGFPDFDNTNFDTVLFVREEICTGQEVACNDDKTLLVNVASEASVAMKADTDYFIFVSGYSAGTFGLEITIPE